MMILPNQYKYLLDEKSPGILVQAIPCVGVQEYPGVHNANPIIMAWSKEVGAKVGMKYDDDDTPWCGLFVAVCAKRAGLALPDIAVRAKSWAGWGTEVADGEAMLGDVLVFERAGGGHVGLYVGEDATHYHVLGGNQGNKVSIARIEKDRCVARRRTAWRTKQPATIRKIELTANGAISKNEA